MWAMVPDGTIQAQGGCLDVSNSGTADGSLVQHYECNGSGAQQWRAQSNGALLNPESGKCLDDPNSSTANSTQVQIYTCNGTNAQTWAVPST